MEPLHGVEIEYRFYDGGSQFDASRQGERRSIENLSKCLYNRIWPS